MLEVSFYLGLNNFVVFLVDSDMFLKSQYFPNTNRKCLSRVDRKYDVEIDKHSLL
jgi:hypothetical protein